MLRQFVTLPLVSLFDALEAELSSHSIPWENAVGLASVRASVTVGISNSVLSRVREKQGNIFSLACVCHLAALSAASGLKALPFSVDNLLIDIFTTVNIHQSVGRSSLMF